MILGLGIDLCEIDRMRGESAEKLMRRCCTEEEMTYIHSRGAAAPQTMAGLWAAKEAAVKALGTGLSLPLKEIEIVHTDMGQPRYRLTGSALTALGEGWLCLSITHEGNMAAAVCIWEG